VLFTAHAAEFREEVAAHSYYASWQSEQFLCWYKQSLGAACHLSELHAFIDLLRDLRVVVVSCIDFIASILINVIEFYC